MIQHATITPYSQSLDHHSTVHMKCDVGYRFQDGTEEKDFICDPITEWETLIDTVCYSKSMSHLHFVLFDNPLFHDNMKPNKKADCSW